MMRDRNVSSFAWGMRLSFSPTYLSNDMADEPGLKLPSVQSLCHLWFLYQLFFKVKVDSDGVGYM